MSTGNFPEGPAAKRRRVAPAPIKRPSGDCKRGQTGPTPPSKPASSEETICICIRIRIHIRIRIRIRIHICMYIYIYIYISSRPSSVKCCGQADEEAER